MSEVQKQYQEQKQNPAGKVGSSAKSKGASLPNRVRLWGAGNAVKGQDERPRRAPLTAFPAPRPRTLFFRLTEAAVVIDKMTAVHRLHMHFTLQDFQEFNVRHLQPEFPVAIS